jgi:holo-ACP synthase/triphosphoribosyl-dephospho-CoA synthase
LAAREQRAILKKQIAQKGYLCLSLSLNVPGFPKSNPAVHQFFGCCLSELQFFLKSHLIDIQHKESVEICDEAGDFFLAPIPIGLSNLAGLKQICEDFEGSHPLGRFVDVDLNDAKGEPISSGKSKLCFFCQVRPAIECRRENTHDPELLRSFMFSKMEEYCHKKRASDRCKQLASFALKALLYEISLTPKPGLVDKFSNGSHTDMDYLTFIDSSAAISCWFEEIAEAGFNFQDSDFTRALPVIRAIGLRMEEAMFSATGDINAQKGIIFLMGLSLFSCGVLYNREDRFEPDQFRTILKAVCKDLVKKELAGIARAEKSHGEEIFTKYGFSGARGEAESGFQTLFRFGLPHLSEVGKLNDAALTKCFLAIASINNDTNILYRRGPAVLGTFQDLCKISLENFSDRNYLAVVEYCKNENISPGGSADLLAISIFIWSVMQAENGRLYNP